MRKSDYIDNQNLEQGVKRLTASESSKTKLSQNNNSTEKIPRTNLLCHSRNRIGTAKRRTTHLVKIKFNALEEHQ
jgi:cellobiose-specific phosphotransferase system component IIA